MKSKLCSITSSSANSWAAMDRIATQLKAEGFQPNYLVDGEMHDSPKLHLKAQLFATREAWDGFIARPEWAEALAVIGMPYLKRKENIKGELHELHDVDVRVDEIGTRMIRNYLDTLTPEQRDKIAFYLTVGSHNMNYRSMMMDGEVQFLATYFDATYAILDFIGMTGLCDWPTTQEELDALLAPYGGMQRLIGRFIKIAL
jgi:hypothetical protein